MEKERLCIDELAAERKVDRRTVYRWIDTGRIPAKLVHREFNGRRYFLRSEIMTYLQHIERMSQNATV